MKREGEGKQQLMDHQMGLYSWVEWMTVNGRILIFKIRRLCTISLTQSLENTQYKSEI
jgi:hypothetical protein